MSIDKMRYRKCNKIMLNYSSHTITPTSGTSYSTRTTRTCPGDHNQMGKISTKTHASNNQNVHSNAEHSYRRGRNGPL